MDTKWIKAYYNVRGLQWADQKSALLFFLSEVGELAEAYAERVQPPNPAFGLNGKAIVQARLIDLERSFPNAVTSLPRLRHHGSELLFPVGNGAQNNLVGFNLAGNQQAHRDRFSQGRIGIGEVIGSGRVQYMCEPGGLEWINSFHKG